MNRLSQPIMLVLGPQGSGKGTQAARLSAEYGIPTVAAGDLLRAAVERGDELGQRVANLINNGILVTIDLWAAVVGAFLDQADLSKGYLLDGVVRTKEQVEAFSSILRARSLGEPWVLVIDLPDAIAVQRLLKRGRHDDTEQAIRARLEWSRTQTEPVIEHYNALRRVVRVDGDQSKDDVYAQIVAALTTRGIVPPESPHVR